MHSLTNYLVHFPALPPLPPAASVYLHRFVGQPLVGVGDGRFADAVSRDDSHCTVQNPQFAQPAGHSLRYALNPHSVAQHAKSFGNSDQSNSSSPPPNIPAPISYFYLIHCIPVGTGIRSSIAFLLLAIDPLLSRPSIRRPIRSSTVNLPPAPLILDWPNVPKVQRVTNDQKWMSYFLLDFFDVDWSPFGRRS